MASGGEAPGALVYVVEAKEEERRQLGKTILDAGYVAVSLSSIDQAINLLRNEASCDLILVSTDSLDDDPEEFDRLYSVREPSPKCIIYGMDPEARLVMHCLNRGAVDFLAKSASGEELLHTVENALSKDRVETTTPENGDAIVAASHICGWIELTATSQLEHFRRLQRFSDALFASRFPEQVCEDLKMAVEEVGRNAVEWGNHFDPNKQIQISYCMFDDRVVIKVQDEGEGFSPQTLPDPTADPVRTMQDRIDAGKRPGGYGVFLIHKLVDSIVYNEKGNSVLLIKYIPKEEQADGS